MLGFPVIR